MKNSSQLLPNKKIKVRYSRVMTVCI
jgi:hypothetical protein